MNINESIRLRTEQKGIKQSYISERTGISDKIISKIMLDQRKIAADEFLAICDAIGEDPRSFRSTEGLT